MWRETDGLKAAARRFGGAAGAQRVSDDLIYLESVAAPVRPQLVQMPGRTKAAEACGVLFALHADAIAKNLHCVLTSVDPEAPHQLRVTLRRLRVALKVFRPVLRTSVRTRIADTARELGAIVGELRDADVAITELIEPYFDDFSAYPLAGALNGWRHEVRGRVRARLTAGQATAFAASVVAAGAEAPKKKRSAAPAASLVRSFLDDTWARAAERAERLPELSHEELHDFRKGVKALRYAMEMETAFSGERHAKAARSLKRIQDLLGHVNDVAALTQFNPPVLERAALSAIRERLIAKHSEGLSTKIADAGEEWRYLARHWPWKREMAVTREMA